MWLTTLIDDFAAYVEVVRRWKEFVFAVRNMLNWSKFNQTHSWVDPIAVCNGLD